MPNRIELQTIAKTRLKEVKVLYRHGLYDGARYLSGYIIETALKARICRILNSDYPNKRDIAQSFLTHNFDTLVKFGGLQKVLDVELSSNFNFKTNWSLMTDWSETFRYRPIGNCSQTEMQDVLNALENKTDGVLTWIKKRW